LRKVDPDKDMAHIKSPYEEEVPDAGQDVYALTQKDDDRAKKEIKLLFKKL